MSYIEHGKFFCYPLPQRLFLCMETLPVEVHLRSIFVGFCPPLLQATVADVTALFQCLQTWHQSFFSFGQAGFSFYKKLL